MTSPTESPVDVILEDYAGNGKYHRKRNPFGYLGRNFAKSRVSGARVRRLRYKFAPAEILLFVG